MGKVASINGVGKTEKPHATEWNSTTFIYYTPKLTQNVVNPWT